MDYLPFELKSQEDYLVKMYGINQIREGSFVSIIQNKDECGVNSIYELYGLLERLRRQYPSSMFRVIHCYISGAFWNSSKDFIISDRILDIGNKPHVSIWAIKTHLQYIFTEKDSTSNFSIFDFQITLKQISQKRRSKRRPISGVTRQNVLMRDNYTCQICGRTIKDGVSLEIDHRLPVSKGGTNDENNLQVLCSQCNREKHNRDDLLHDKRKLGELEGK